MCLGMTGDLLDCFAIFVSIAQWYCRFYSGLRCSSNTRATRGKGDNGQIAGARGYSNVRQFNGVCGEFDQNNNHPTMDGGVQWRWHWTTMHQSN